MALSHWSLLGFVCWTLLLLIGTVGYTRVSAVMRGQARPNAFNAALPHGSDGYQRCMRAHLNCIENLPIFAALVLLGSSQATGQWFEVAALIVLPARVGQSVTHVSSGRNRAVLIRFCFYCVQLLCFGLMIGALMIHALRSPQ